MSLLAWVMGTKRPDRTCLPSRLSNPGFLLRVALVWLLVLVWIFEDRILTMYPKLILSSAVFLG